MSTTTIDSNEQNERADGTSRAQCNADELTDTELEAAVGGAKTDDAPLFGSEVMES